MLTRTFSLDMVPGGVPLHIHVSQYDSDEEIILHLFSSQGTLSVPSSGVSAKIRGTKVDGNGIDNVCTFSFTDDVPTVTVKLTQQMTAVVGKNPFEIVLTAVDDTSGEGYELPSATFYLIVKKAALDYETVGSNSDIAEIADVMAKADRLISSAQTIEKAAAEIKAGGFAGQDDLNALQSDVSNIEETVENLKTAVGNKVQGGYLSNNALFLVTDDYGSLGPFTGMMDVAKEQGKEADCRIISERLGIPVIPFVASDRKKYDSFYELLKKGDKEGGIISPHMLEQLYEKEFGGQYKEIISHLPEDGISVYGKSWLFAKLAEGDTAAMKLVIDSVSAEDFGTIRETLDQIENGASRTGNCKFRWIDSLLDGAITRADVEKKKNSFDRIALSKRWGKPLAISPERAALVCWIPGDRG